MKRVYDHPPREARPKMWRSLGELEGDPAFDEWLHREFPRGADVYEDSGLSRRDFMKLLGASMALAGVGFAGCRRPESYLVPFTKAVEFTIPGKNLYYATAMPTRMGLMPLIATTVDGRPIKIEGNPVHPDSTGATDIFAQASVLDLYDPHRAKDFRKAGQPVPRADFDAALAALRQAALASQGKGLAILAEPSSSPTRALLRAALERDFPGLLWAEYDPLSLSQAEQATAAAFGPGARILPRLENADTLLALDADFLNPSETGPAYARGYYKRRNPDAPGGMNRLYVVESHFTITGGMADHRLPLKAALIGDFTAALATELARLLRQDWLASLASAFPRSGAQLPTEWLTPLAADLAAHKGRAAVLVGPYQPAAVQALGLAINQALGAFDPASGPLRVVNAAEPALAATPLKPAATISDLAAALNSGAVKHLFILGGNPAYNAPACQNLPEALPKAGEIFRLSLFEDETSHLAAWQIPAAHYLESWGDGRTWQGTLTAIQPMILPLYGGLSELDLLQLLLGQQPQESPALIQATFARLTGAPAGQPDPMAWAEFLRNGFLPGSEFAPLPNPTFDTKSAKALLAAAKPAQPQAPEIVFLQSGSVDDGRYANNSWLLETPDFATKLTWDNALLVSLADMKKLGARDGDLAEISLAGRAIEAALITAPGQAEGSYAIALGYGHKGVSALMDNVGFNAYPLRALGAERFAQGPAIRLLPGRRYTFARTQEHHSMEGRDLFREGPLDHYRQKPDFVMDMGEFAHLTPLVQQGHMLFSQNFLTAKEQWAMAIDLNLCTGCNACLVACRAENNVPVVGKEQVRRGRDMAWIRIDRWFAGEPEAPEMLAQPILCQQCENAPCETVCPVNATVHSEDGLNLMAYNRCIGTRYCANNCPWKVRRFNFFDYHQRPLDKLYWGPLAPKGKAESLKMVMNPNVTVRMRGVMEKCTFCIQRIEEAKIARLVEAGPRDKYEVKIGPFQVACQQACPADAIVFGDQNDPDSLVSKLRKAQRGYTMFGYINARPRITYLARIKNPNPAMPGAKLVGRVNSIFTGGHGGGHQAPHDAAPHGEKQPAAPHHGAAPASPLRPPFEHIPTGVMHGAEASAS